MELTDVRIKLVEDPRSPVLAYCFIVFDQSFVVRDIKLIERQGRRFVAMPSRKRTIRCEKCTGKNDVQSRYCMACGQKIPETSGRAQGRTFTDVAHPITSAFRQLIQQRVFEAFERERELAEQPDYVCTYHDLDDFSES